MMLLTSSYKELFEKNKMITQTQEQRREWNPTLEIVRRKRYDEGKRVVSEQLHQTKLDSKGRVIKTTGGGLIRTYSWSEDGHVCTSGIYNSSCAGIKGKGPFGVCVSEYSEDGRNLTAENRLVRERDSAGRISRLNNRSSNYEIEYDAQNRLVRALGFNKDNSPRSIQQTQYLQTGGTRTVIYPCGREISPTILNLQNGNLNDFRPERNMVFRAYRTLFPGQNTRYVETQRQRVGKDEEGRNYHATLTQAWLEDIASGKRIDGTKFSEMKIEK